MHAAYFYYYHHASTPGHLKLRMSKTQFIYILSIFSPFSLIFIPIKEPWSTHSPPPRLKSRRKTAYYFTTISIQPSHCVNDFSLIVLKFVLYPLIQTYWRALRCSSDYYKSSFLPVLLPPGSSPWGFQITLKNIINLFSLKKIKWWLLIKSLHVSIQIWQIKHMW